MKKREIKFRAWNKATQEMEYEIEKSYCWEFAIDENDDNRTLMQFTGLHDKNDKEIYEGDVIGDCRYAKDKQVVRWGLCGWSPFEGDINSEDSESVEIIGNIHENPELLTPLNHQ